MMTRPTRRLSLSRVAQLKSTAGQLAQLRRIINNTDLPKTTVLLELDRLQTAMYAISRTPKRSVL